MTDFAKYLDFSLEGDLLRKKNTKLLQDLYDYVRGLEVVNDELRDKLILTLKLKLGISEKLDYYI